MRKRGKNKCDRLWKKWAKKYGDQAEKSKYAYYCDGDKISERTQKKSDADKYDDPMPNEQIKEKK
tara:strand:+ start:22731 stop:22925 length:195 start_codon:yes stop_codon:yes gene_type:complete